MTTIIIINKNNIMSFPRVYQGRINQITVYIVTLSSQTGIEIVGHEVAVTLHADEIGFAYRGGSRI